MWKKIVGGECIDRFSRACSSMSSQGDQPLGIVMVLMYFFSHLTCLATRKFITDLVRGGEICFI